MDKKFKEIMNNRKLPSWNELPEIELYMDQVIVLMEKYLGSSPDDKLITPSMINNYVKLNIIPPPEKKKYSKVHIAYLIIICSLKQVMPISDIKVLIDEKLKQCTIEELLDEYGKLYHESIEVICDTTEKNEKDSSVSPAMFLAVSASICRFASELCLSDALKEAEKKAKEAKKEKKKEKEKEGKK